MAWTTETGSFAATPSHSPHTCNSSGAERSLGNPRHGEHGYPRRTEQYHCHRRDDTAYSPYSLWYWFDGSIGTCGIPLDYKAARVVPNNTWQYNYGFISRHGGDANFGFCDTSVHFINDQIDIYVYQCLATINGGESLYGPAGRHRAEGGATICPLSGLGRGGRGLPACYG